MIFGVLACKTLGYWISDLGILELKTQAHFDSMQNNLFGIIPFLCSMIIQTP